MSQNRAVQLSEKVTRETVGAVLEALKTRIADQKFILVISTSTDEYEPTVYPSQLFRSAEISWRDNEPAEITLLPEWANGTTVHIRNERVAAHGAMRVSVMPNKIVFRHYQISAGEIITLLVPVDR